MNKRRQGKDLSTLDVLTIPLLEDEAGDDEGELRHAVTKEDKISSSGRRFDALGTKLRTKGQRDYALSPCITGFHVVVKILSTL